MFEVERIWKDTNFRWAEFKEFPGYAFTELGDVWSKKRGKYLSPVLSHNGYNRVRIPNKDGKYQWVRVAVMVATAFCERPEGTWEVDHINRNTICDCASNLRWVTHKQNMENSSHVYKQILKGLLFDYDNYQLSIRELLNIANTMNCRQELDDLWREQGRDENIILNEILGNANVDFLL